MFFVEEELESVESGMMDAECDSIALRKYFPEAWIWDVNSTVLVDFILDSLYFLAFFSAVVGW